MSNSTPVLIQMLLERFKTSLPGSAAHLKIARAWRKMHIDAPADARKAAVLVLLYPKMLEGQMEWFFILTQRATHERDKHSGQISFPGGGYHASDGALPQGMLSCALREAQEEIGVQPHIIQIIGQMTDLYIPVSKYQVFPYLGWTNQSFTTVLQASEVQSVLEVPLSLLTDPNGLKVMDMHLANQVTLKNVPYFDLLGKCVWGATAMILMELVEILRD